MRKWLNKASTFFRINATVRHVVATLVSLLLYSSGISQADPYVYNPLPNIMSPEAANLGKYGSYNVNYYTGVPDISIPLHSFSENGVDVNLALSYDASGFVPNKNAGVAGLNWNLIAGGAITRIVNGYPDDKHNPNSEPQNVNNGYIYGQLNGLGTYSPEYIRTIQFISNINNPVYSLNYEYIPDMFSFNFLGHTGRFFMDNAGQIQVTGDRNYKVDLSDMKPQYNWLINIGAVAGSLNSLNNTLYSQIRMTSDDGYIFYFGGSFKTLEIGFSSSPAIGVPDKHNGQINAWYLTKVVSPDGNEILFNYKDYTENDRLYLFQLFNSANGSHRDIEVGFMELKFYRNHSIISHVRKGSDIKQENTRSAVSASLIKHAYLSEIKSRAQTIKFFYGPKDLTTRFYGDYDDPIGDLGTLGTLIRRMHTLRLQTISVIDNFGKNTSPVKDIDLIQDYHGNRMFLKELQFSGAWGLGGFMKYGFSYNIAGERPDPLTLGIDLWGHYNGRKGNTDLVVVPATNSTEYESNPAHPSAYRLPDEAHAKYGILETITYPTGGTTQFKFEGNTYSKVLKRKVSSGITPVWETVNGNAGGLRIAEIKNTPGTTTTYKYVTDYNLNESNPSSGLLTDYPVNYLYFRMPYSGGDEVMARISDNNIATSSSYRETHIAYKEVVEINSEGFTKYKFTNPESNPDLYYLGEDSYKYTDDVSTTNFLQQLKRLYRYSSREDERGKPLATETYNSSKQIKKSVAYEYNTDPQRDAARSIAHYCSFSFFRYVDCSRDPVAGCPVPVTLIQSYALFHYHNLVSKVTEKTYASNSNDYVEQVATYKYKSNTDRLLVEKKVTQSDGSDLVNKYKYPADLAPTAPYDQMVTKNMLRHVVEDGQYKNGTQFLRSIKTNYGTWHSGAILKPISVEKTIGTGQPEVLTAYSSYDNKGNLLTVSKSGNNNPHYSSYIWDYNQRFPIAEITNSGNGEYAYTSFEGDGKGNWVYSGTITEDYPDIPAGLRKYNLTPTDVITRPGLQAGTVYMVTYWTKNTSPFNIPGTIQSVEILNSNNWHCFEHKVAGQTTITISGTGDIDELRLFPVGTIMTTFTWSGLGSMTSRNDAGNRISYYEYDGLNRLVLIRDHDKNIVKRICYNFDGQPTDNCIVSLAPDWKESGIARCLKDANNNNTGYQEKEEVDVNPYSSTYNTKRWKIPVQNCTTCPMPPNWINTGNTKCEETDVAGRFTGRQLQEQVDANNCSASYNTIRWISLGCTSNCPNPEPYWMPTGNRRCVKDASNNNTGEVQVEYTDINECTVYGQKKWESGGYSCTECATPSTVPNWQPTGNTRCKQPGTTGEQEREEKDMNPCSAQFGNLRWASVGLNCAICPITNCLAPSNKVINCVCEAGVKNYVSSVYTKVGTVWKYKCTYFWCFSDALSSTQYFVEYHDTPCTVGGACLQ